MLPNVVIGSTGRAAHSLARSRKYAGRGAFTLVELLVALAILSAVAVLLFPVFARAREQARRSVCASNLHQIGVALAIYRSDYDGIDPAVGSGVPRNVVGFPYKMPALVDAYIRTHAILFCPSYAGWRPLRYLYTTYWPQFTLNEIDDPMLDFQSMFAQAGMNYPTVICDSHIPVLPVTAQNAGDVWYYEILRLDGRVTVRKTYADAAWRTHWWQW